MGSALSTAIESRYRAFRREYQKTLRLEHHLPGLEKPRSFFRRLGRVCGTIARNLTRRDALLESAKRPRCYSCETEFNFFRRGDNCGTCRMTHCGGCSRSRGFFKSPTCRTCVEMKEHGFDNFFRDKFEPLKKLSPRDVQPIFTGQGTDLFLIKRTLELQEQNFRDYSKKVVDDWKDRVGHSANFLVRDGKHAKNLPRDVRRSLRNRELLNGRGRLPMTDPLTTGTWLVHEEKDDLLDFTIEITIEVRLDKITTEETERTRWITYYYIIIITVRLRDSE